MALDLLAEIAHLLARGGGSEQLEALLRAVPELDGALLMDLLQDSGDVLHDQLMDLLDQGGPESGRNWGRL